MKKLFAGLGLLSLLVGAPLAIAQIVQGQSVIRPYTTAPLMSTQNADAVAITGGTINGTTVGATTPAAGSFTTLTASSTISPTGQILAGDGTSGAPSHSFTSGTDTGMYSPSTHAVTVKGGVVGASSAGGAVALTGGAGGATSGAGGTATVTGGAAVAGNSAGGATGLTGGAGQGTGNGGASAVTGGSSGAGLTGNGGAASLTGGAAASTNGTGGAGSLAGGAGIGTGTGGAASLTSGAGGLTGASGAVTVASGVGGGTSGNSGNVIVAPGTVTSGTRGTVLLGDSTTTLAPLQIAPAATVVNAVTITGAATGTAPAIAVGGAGADANRNLSIKGSGTGIVALGQTICTVTGTTPQICNGQRGIVTTGTLTTAGATASSYTVTNSSVSTSSLVLVTLQAYSGTLVTNGYPVIFSAVPGNGSFVVNFANTHASNALNGTFAIGFVVLN